MTPNAHAGADPESRAFFIVSKLIAQPASGVLHAEPDARELREHESLHVWRYKWKSSDGDPFGL